MPGTVTIGAAIVCQLELRPIVTRVAVEASAAGALELRPADQVGLEVLGGSAALEVGGEAAPVVLEVRPQPAAALAITVVRTELAVQLSTMGVQGPAGEQGPEGPAGPAGADGDPGPAGPQGDAGPAGPEGPQGPQGAQGDPGPAGADGSDGASAYAVAVANGFVGTEAEWLASLVGPEGPEGPQGPAGADGADGAQGPQGEQGPAGPQGDVGPQGPEGPQGPAGDSVFVATTRLDPSGFDGVTTTFPGLLPAEPLDPLSVVLYHAGVGPIFSVATVPASGEFRLSGTENRDVQFGRPPKAGAQAYALPYVRA